jgi:hypothetical protein
VVAHEPRRPSDEPPATGPQHYVVQLDWSVTPVSAGSVPRLAVFRRYNVYTVRTLRDGNPQHGLRLGFFNAVEEAQYVAEQARAHYPLAGVLPASHREYTRAVELLQQRALKAIAKVEPLRAQPTKGAPAPIAQLLSSS